MDLIRKEGELTFDDLNSYLQFFSIVVCDKKDDGYHIEVIEYYKNLKTLMFDRYDIRAVVTENKEILCYSKDLKYAVDLGDEDTPHIIISELSAGKIYLNKGEIEFLFPVNEFVE